MDLEEFIKLEAKVLELGRKYQNLKEEKERLEKDLKGAREKMEYLEGELQEIKSTRRDILKKVDSLIRHLETENNRLNG